VAANENAEREVNTMKILLRNMEESKKNDLKRYKEDLAKVETLKENMRMEIEDMHSKSSEVFRIYSNLNQKYITLEEENIESKTEISRLDKLQKETEKLRDETQQTLEQTECILHEYSELYTIQTKETKESEKLKTSMDIHIRKLEKENKKKDFRLKEMHELKEKLRINEHKLEEFKDQNNKVFADFGCQAQEEESQTLTKTVQTDMSINKIRNLEKGLNHARMEANKYLKIVKSMKSQEESDKISNISQSISKIDDSPPPSPEKEIMKEQIITPKEIVEDKASIEAEEVKEEINSAEKEKIKLEEKQKIRSDYFRKKIQKKNKPKRSPDAYESLDQYQKRTQKEKQENSNSQTPKADTEVIIEEGNKTFDENLTNLKATVAKEDIQVEELKINQKMENEGGDGHNIPRHVIELNLSKGKKQVIFSYLNNIVENVRNLSAQRRPESVEDSLRNSGKEIISNQNLINGKNLNKVYFI